MTEQYLKEDGGAAPSHVEMLMARHVALVMLMQVLERRQPLDQVLDQSPAFYDLVRRDRRFVRMLVTTTLRRLGQIDDLIVKAADKDEVPHPPVLRALLRMGVAQLGFMNVPDYAVVDTCVQIAEQEGLARQKGFLNAVLRRIADHAQDWLGRQDEGRLNVPDWVMKQWIADYELRLAAEIAQASLSEAALDITVKNKDQAGDWAQTLEAAILPTGSLRRPSGGRVEELPGFDDGMWWIQDAAAALPVQLFGDVKGRRVIDLCAAPGGKTAQLAAAGAEVIAVDRSVKRLKRLQDNMRRLRLEDSVQTEVADGTVWQPRAPVDCVLLDAPCTATGTIRRHPDIFYLKTEQDLRNLCDVQARLLDNAFAMLKPGGILVLLYLFPAKG